MSDTIDPVTLQVMGNHLRAAAETMAYTLYRTAFSTFVKETEDFTTQITDAAGVAVAVPIDLGASLVSRHHLWPRHGDDQAIMNPATSASPTDPYSGYVATHVPDMHMWKPVFAEGRIIGLACGHIHNTGGAVPASLSRALTEVHQEGIRFPPMKLFRRGVMNDELRRVMLLNVRKPDPERGRSARLRRRAEHR